MALIRAKLTAHSVKTRQARLGLPGNVDMITGSALTGKCPASPALGDCVVIRDGEEIL